MCVIALSALCSLCSLSLSLSVCVCWLTSCWLGESILAESDWEERRRRRSDWEGKKKDGIERNRKNAKKRRSDWEEEEEEERLRRAEAERERETEKRGRGGETEKGGLYAISLIMTLSPHAHVAHTHYYALLRTYHTACTTHTHTVLITRGKDLVVVQCIHVATATSRWRGVLCIHVRSTCAIHPWQIFNSTTKHGSVYKKKKLLHNKVRCYLNKGT